MSARVDHTCEKVTIKHKKGCNSKKKQRGSGNGSGSSDSGFPTISFLENQTFVLRNNIRAGDKLYLNLICS